MRYLSAEWMDAAARALAGDAGLREATAEVALTLEQVVTGVPGANGIANGHAREVRWHVRIDRGAVRLVPGPADAFDVRFTTDYATAAAVAAGTTGAQQAFAEGRLRVGGDVAALGRHHRAFAAVTDALAAVRAETTYDASGEGG